MRPPTFSIVIPCYNQSKYLGDCLGSVLAQTFENWEVIVIDDASTEGNVSASGESFQDRRIRFVRHDRNLGLAATRNTGFRLAQASLVLPLDADDMLTPTYLQKVGAALQDDPDADCAYPDFQLFGLRDDVWHNQVYDAEKMTRGQWIPGPGTLMRRSLWERVGGYCEAPELRPGNEDWDFWLGAVTKGVRAIYVQEALYLYRRHETSMVTRLKYYDFQTREFMYCRHRALFDRYRTGKEFLAQGFLNSAYAALQRGERSRAAYLATQAWRFLPERKDVLKLAAKIFIPPFLFPAARKGWGMLKGLSDAFMMKAFKHL